MHRGVAEMDSESRYVQTFHRFQNGQSITVLASLPATILIAAVTGTFTPREMWWAIGAALVLAAFAVPLSHALDRKNLSPIRAALRDPHRTASPESLFRRVWRFPRRVFIMYMVVYLGGGFWATFWGNHFAGLPSATNLGPFVFAGAVGGIVDGTLNYLSSERFSAQVCGLIAQHYKMFAPVAPGARGGVGRRLIVTLLIIIGITVAALAGSSIHLLTLLSSGGIAAAQALRLGYIYAGAAIVVAILFAGLATRLLMQGFAMPILRTVELMDRLRQGDILRVEELYSEPRLPHEAGLLVSAFAEANVGLARLATGGEQLASGDLSVKIVPISERDVVAVAFAKVAQAIRSVVEDVTATAQLLDHSSLAIAARTQEFSSDAQANASDLSNAAQSMQTLDGAVVRVASGADELSGMVDQSRTVAERLAAAAASNAAGLEELGMTAKATIEAAMEVLQLSNSTNDSADSAAAAIVQADNTSEEAEKVMHDLVAAVDSLRDSSQKIGTITEKIDEIADQTNLLALNAAIEAARAGEHGRGYAVVADEIRKLADSSASATHEIPKLNRSVQTETDRAVNVTKRGTEAVAMGRQKTELVSDALSRIVDNIQLMRARIEAVVLAQKEQKVATDSLVDSTLTVERTTAENSTFAQTLSTLADQLQDSASSGATAVRSTASDVSSVAQRGERIAAASSELQSLTASMRAEAERIRAAVAGFHSNGTLTEGDVNLKLSGS
ncbi:MAG: hypothetical protein NVSMB31_13300 [Vulcanimicrobiaceae bacterium]